MNSLEIAFENLSSAKNEMGNLVQDFFRQCIEARNVDVTINELKQITALCLEMTAVDVAEIYAPPRFTKRAADFWLKTRIRN